MSYKIESGIPLPPRSGGRFPLRALKVGESFFVNAKDGGQSGRVIYTAAANLTRRSPTYRFSIRKIAGGFRVWRVKA